MEDTLTPEDIKSDINIFQGFSDDHIKERLDDATLKASHDQISDDALINATRAWTRHLLYKDWFMNYGGVQSASTFGNSQTMINFNGYDDYRAEYDDIVDDYGVSDSMGAVWTE